MVTVRRDDHAKILAAVFGMPQADVDDIDFVGVLWTGVDARVIPGPLPQLASFVDLGPRRAGVIGAKDAAVLCFDDGPDAIGVRGRYGDADDADRALRQSLVARDLLPCVAAVDALPEAGAIAAAFQTEGGTPDSPSAGVENPGIVRVEAKLETPRVLIHEQDALPGFAAIGAAEHAAFFVGAIQVSQRRDIDDIGILGMDAHARDVPRVAQPDVLPRDARISRFPHAVAVRDVAAHGFLTPADIDDIRIGFADCDSADRAAEESIGDVLPARAAVGGPPDAAAGAAKVEQQRLAGHAGDGRRTSAAKGTDGPIAQRRKPRFIERLCSHFGRCCSAYDKGQQRRQRAFSCARQRVHEHNASVARRFAVIPCLPWGALYQQALRF